MFLPFVVNKDEYKLVPCRYLYMNGQICESLWAFNMHRERLSWRNKLAS